TSIREDRPAAAHDYQAVSEAAAVTFFRGLADGARGFGRALAEHRLQGDERVLDIGGGAGHALAGMLDIHPGLQATLFELPQTLAVAQILLADHPRRDAIHFEAGDIGTSGSVQGHDVVLMKALLQCLAPSEARCAVAHAFASLDPGGKIFITGVGILDDGGLSPPAAVFYDLTFMNLYQGGASYTRSTYADWLRMAGFEAIEFGTLPSGSLVITARRPQ
ncbi:MAG TPA: methyltransferase, partial [Terriglobales bacterium]|nr:methyltransferase [Terriglobales bacterium]